MALVFISHRVADVAEAEHLAIDLRAAGHEVWLDEWELDVGDSIPGAMNEGLKTAEYVVLCYSVHGVESPWIAREWLSALARQLEGKGIKILPVVLTGGDAPAILADLKTADLTADRDRGVQQLLRALAR